MKKIKAEYIAEPIFAVAVLLAVYAVKGYYPFGGLSIAMGDLYAQGTALLYSFYDAMLGDGSFFYNFLTFAGTNTFATSAIYVFSPFHLLLLLFPREELANAVNILLLVRVAAASVFAVLFFRKAFPGLPVYWAVFFSLTYALSGYLLCAYLVYAWLDVFCFFPLLMYTLLLARDKGRYIPYTIVLCAMLVMCFYICAMMLILLFLCCAVYIYAYVPREKRAITATALSLHTLAALAIASPVVVPAAVQILSSIRNNTDVLSVIMRGDLLVSVLDKANYFLLSGCTLVFTLLLFIRYKNRRCRIFLLIVGFITCVPLIVDGTNQLLHLGSYAMFPLRYGFVPIFFLCAAGAYYWERTFSGELPSTGKPLPGRLSVPVAFLAIVLPVYPLYYCFSRLYPDTHPAGIDTNAHVFLPMLYVFAAFAVSFLLIGFLATRKPFPGKKYGHGVFAVTLVLFAAQAVSFGLIFIGLGSDDPQFAEAERISKLSEYSFDDSGYYRVLDKDMLFSTPNANLILGTNSLSHYSSQTSAHAHNLLSSLGYSNAWVSTFDIGGTLFSDLLLGGRYRLSAESLSDSALSPEAQTDGTYLYRYIDAFPVGMVLDGPIESFALENGDSPIANQSAVYKALTGRELFQVANIVSDFSGGEAITMEPGVYTETIQISGKQRLYLDAALIESSFAQVAVNGVPVSTQIANEINKWTNPTGFAYPSVYQNSLLYLGEFEDCPVEIGFTVGKPVSVTRLDLAQLDADELASFTQNILAMSEFTVRRNTISVNAESDGNNKVLFLPFDYDGGWRATINGKPAEVNEILGGFIGVELSAGENELQMVFIPRYMNESIIVSVCAIILLTVYHLLKKRSFFLKSLCNPAAAVGLVIFTIGIASVFVIIYVLPFIFAVVRIL